MFRGRRRLRIESLVTKSGLTAACPLLAKEIYPDKPKTAKVKTAHQAKPLIAISSVQPGRFRRTTRQPAIAGQPR